MPKNLIVWVNPHYLWIFVIISEKSKTDSTITTNTHLIADLLLSLVWETFRSPFQNSRK